MSAGKRMGQAYESWLERKKRKSKQGKNGKPWNPKGKSKRARRMVRAGMRDEIRRIRILSNRGAGHTDYPTRWDKRKIARLGLAEARKYGARTR